MKNVSNAFISILTSGVVILESSVPKMVNSDQTVLHTVKTDCTLFKIDNVI